VEAERSRVHLQSRLEALRRDSGPGPRLFRPPARRSPRPGRRSGRASTPSTGAAPAARQPTSSKSWTPRCQRRDYRRERPVLQRAQPGWLHHRRQQRGCPRPAASVHGRQHRPVRLL